MRALKVGDGLLPLSDLKAHASEVIKQVNDTGRPVVVTKHGRGVAVLMSVDAFDEYQEVVEREAIRRALEAAENQIARGEHVDLDDVKEMFETRWAQEDAE